MQRIPNYEVVIDESTPECLVVRDLGPWDAYPSVTNRAEELIEDLKRRELLKPGQRLEYYDSEGNRDQIRLSPTGHFAGFAPGRTG